MNHQELNSELESMLEEFGSVADTRLESIDAKDFQKEIEASEKELEKEYFEIEQIKVESLKDAMNEKLVYV